jgi:RNA polymerase sigma-70 factor (ECF subfamily)
VTIDARQERFRALYESALPRVIAYALRRTRSADDAADVVAETFTIAWRRIDDVPVGDYEIAWCYATARRVIANHRRGLRRQADLITRVGAELAATLAPQLDPPSESLLATRAAFDRLEEEDRELLMLVGWEGLNSAQLAVVLRCSPTAARIRLHRARSRLLAEMAESEMGAKQRTKSGHSSLRGPALANLPGEV